MAAQVDVVGPAGKPAAPYRLVSRLQGESVLAHAPIPVTTITGDAVPDETVPDETASPSEPVAPVSNQAAGCASSALRPEKPPCAGGNAAGSGRDDPDVTFGSVPSVSEPCRGGGEAGAGAGADNRTSLVGART
ncbi:hypothetical protein SCWH03_27850 [Streptomyces pacificus]|uniref:Uncharacterized protein n=1 Tax=Streptomyces pacificus TaxID=2705029 RepID=A0A6A0AUL4_9ACTN|nr:hypothetical protein SCWH03_27850 [Streptomyces pacificus]